MLLEVWRADSCAALLVTFMAWGALGDVGIFIGMGIDSHVAGGARC